MWPVQDCRVDAGRGPPQALFAERGCGEGVAACALGDTATLHGGFEGDRPDTAPALLDSAVRDRPRRYGQVEPRHASVRDRENSCVRTVSGQQGTRTGGRNIASVHGRHDQIEALDTDARSVERVCLAWVDQMNLRQVAALLVDGEESELRLPDQRDVVSGRAGGSDETDEN